MGKNSIPKIIHYCWFGNGEKSELAKKCLKSWKEHLPDYKLIEWNEDKININSNKYMKLAYENKKYSFVADYVRIYALYHYGGIYLDLDVELKKTFNPFLNNKMFLSFEDNHHISTAIIGSVQNHFFLKEILDYYDHANFSLKTNVDLITQKLCQYGLIENNYYQKICQNEITIFPNYYFSPLKFGENIAMVTDNTVCIHLFEGTWQDKRIKRKLKIINFMKKIMSEKLYYIILRRLKGDSYHQINIGVVNFNNSNYYEYINKITFFKYYTYRNILKEGNGFLSNLIFLKNVLKNKVDFLVFYQDVDVFVLKILKVLALPTIRIYLEKSNNISNLELYTYSYKEELIQNGNKR